MTPTEKRYLLFLSPRTPRPKSADRPGTKVLKRMEQSGWIALKPGRGLRVNHPDFYITEHGERALDALSAPRCYVEWHTMDTAPIDQHLLFTNGDMVRSGVFDGDAVHAGVVSSRSLWTHWAALPSPPRAEGGE